MLVGSLNQVSRNRWIEETLKNIEKGSRILDAGAGEQKYKKYCLDLIYVAQDFAEYDGKGNGIGLHSGKWDQTKLDIISDIVSIPEPDSSFDAIMCIEVFEHLPNPILAIKEFSRLLKNNGKLILTAPFCSLTHLAPYHFYSGFNKYFYEKWLNEYGFKIIEINNNGNYFEYLAQEVRRIKTVAQEYSDNKPNLIETISIKLILKMLQRFSNNDKNSHELLNFGYQILAEKSF